MMTYVDMIQDIKNDIDLYLVVILSIILVANIIDFLLGWVNAKFNKKVVFKSNVALYGIIKKMLYFIVLILFGVIGLAILPDEISIPSIITLFLGYLFSELNSILSHMDLTSDGKRGEIFKDFLDRIMKGGK